MYKRCVVVVVVVGDVRSLDGESPGSAVRGRQARSSLAAVGADTGPNVVWRASPDKHLLVHHVSSQPVSGDTVVGDWRSGRTCELAGRGRQGGSSLALPSSTDRSCDRGGRQPDVHPWFADSASHGMDGCGWRR